MSIYGDSFAPLQAVVNPNSEIFNAAGQAGAVAGQSPFVNALAGGVNSFREARQQGFDNNVKQAAVDESRAKTFMDNLKNGVVMASINGTPEQQAKAQAILQKIQSNPALASLAGVSSQFDPSALGLKPSGYEMGNDGKFKVKYDSPDKNSSLPQTREEALQQAAKDNGWTGTGDYRQFIPKDMTITQTGKGFTSSYKPNMSLSETEQSAVSKWPEYDKGVNEALSLLTELRSQYGDKLPLGVGEAIDSKAYRAIDVYQDPRFGKLLAVMARLRPSEFFTDAGKALTGMEKPEIADAKFRMGGLPLSEVINNITSMYNTMSNKVNIIRGGQNAPATSASPFNATQPSNTTQSLEALAASLGGKVVQ